ncbi:3-isopropylmalate dehydrogenase [Bacillus canaveralius]|uniref:3-isopropylmalate dehydrogenase n=1 Tax=Bacillus canaveralius TaxID=1403243 RepID=A0A2N5GQ67_9BACI|nr:3-isopropylmalate dehydrogenase [Bacillus canaveralius]PLR85015.1 3-isopropylmalate dehydrogenase [Bacillus canaveralius]PLR93276.1 3-isopropylmalate dehydrogenase [Bacillus canaveralius]RSK52476.1 3-isopropylmalate dehydrogenase [Bacillus canaveralius]
MKKRIAVLPGDGIGKEVTKGAIEVLQAIGERFGHQFYFSYGKIGGEAIDDSGTPLAEETVQLCRESDAVLLGAVGGPKWDRLPVDLRPERGLLKLRKDLDLYANLRPTNFYASLADSSPLRIEVIEGVDLLMVRELTGGLYFGKPSERTRQNGEEAAVDTLFYQRQEVERVIETAFELASKRNKKVTSVDKANVLESSRMWREVAEETARKYPDVELTNMLVDNAAMQMIKNPKQFDVVVTENMFGDILSDEASVLTGSLGMLPSASLSLSGPYLYEPIHGSAPDIEGKNIANPVGMILSAAMMLRLSFGLEEEAVAVENAVVQVLEAGFRTRDIAAFGKTASTTTEMAGEIKAALHDDEAILNIMGAYA